jgi:hypothetical protein
MLFPNLQRLRLCILQALLSCYISTVLPMRRQYSNTNDRNKCLWCIIICIHFQCLNFFYNIRRLFTQLFVEVGILVPISYEHPKKSMVFMEDQNKKSMFGACK